MHRTAKNQQTRIKAKVALTTLLTVLIVLIAVSWSFFFYFHNLLRESIFTQQCTLVSEIAEQLNGRSQLALYALLIATVGILFLLLVVWQVTRRKTRPIQQLIAHIDGVCKPGGEWKPLHLTTGDELEQLVDAINGMMDEIRRIQTELRNQRAFAEELINKAAVPIFALDCTHRILVWNSAMENLSGLKSDEMLGTTRQWEPFYPAKRPVLADIILAGDERQLDTLYNSFRLSQHVQGGVQSEGWYENVNGQRRYLFFDAAPICDKNGRNVAAIETLLDITQQKIYEAELLNNTEELLLKHKEQNTLFALVNIGKREWEDTMDSIPEMVLMCDPIGAITRCNHAVATFTSRTYNQILGLDCLELLVRSGMEISSCDDSKTHMTYAGGSRHFELHFNELKQLGSNEVRGSVVTVYETTEFLRVNEELKKASIELRQAQAQAFQQEKMASIGQLAAGVAHEINNPMGFISSNLTTMGKYMHKLHAFEDALIDTLQKRGDREAVELLNNVRAQMKIDFILNDLHTLLDESRDGAERVRCIVRDLKSFSHQDEALCKPFSINDCLDSTLNMARNEIKYVADVELDYDPALPLLNCYPQKLNQVFMNLLVNAAHAIEGHGTIRIKTFSENGDIVVCVSDTGKGIAPENLTRIFEPFFTTKEVGKGTGLGLSISYDIIKKHGGTINVESKLGAGTTFTVRLPLNPTVTL